MDAGIVIGAETGRNRAYCVRGSSAYRRPQFYRLQKLDNFWRGFSGFRKESRSYSFDSAFGDSWADIILKNCLAGQFLLCVLLFHQLLLPPPLNKATNNKINTKPTITQNQICV